jgi:hypothetical protein
VEGVFDGGGDEEEVAVAGAEEAFGDGVVKKGEEGVVEAVEVEQEDGFAVEAEGLPGEDLEHLFQGAEATGEDEEGVGAPGHEGFAGVHGVDDVELGEAAMGDLHVDEDLGDDADDATSVSEGGVGDGLHEADVGAAVDEADAVGGEGLAEGLGGLGEVGVGAVGGGAEDGEVLGRHGSKDSAGGMAGGGRLTLLAKASEAEKHIPPLRCGMTTKVNVA